MQPRFFVVNFKSHKITDDVLVWLETVGEALQTETFTDTIIVCPQMPSLESARKRIDEAQWEGLFKLGAQSVSPFGEGAYTGEVSATALQGLVDYVIVGHSERRRLFGEKTETIQKQAEQAFANGMTPIYCVSEATVAELPLLKNKQYVIAYEPPAAIGSGTAESIPVITAFVEKAAQAVDNNSPILYGGSVNETNIKTISAIPKLTGFLIGSAALNAQDFLRIVYAIR